ncbi:MAG: acyl-ACP--UDP-N-acetylglucosamine O-acyltransferase [Thiotrichales bacterium]
MIDPRAIVDPDADLAHDVEIGPYTIIGPDVRIDSGTWIGPHVVIKGPTRIGKGNKIFQFASLGEAPQDLKYQGEPTELVIGDRNTIREYVTLNRGTVSGHGRTVIGDDNLLMAYVHVAHDCHIGNRVVFANATSLAGHVTIEDQAILGGFTLVHQFSRVGQHAFTGMGTALNRDLPPFCTASGNYARAIGINKEGLKRRGFSAESIRALGQAFKILIKGSDWNQNLAEVENLAESFAEVRIFLEFICSSQRGVVR